MAKITDKIKQVLKADKREIKAVEKEEKHLETGAAPELHPEFDPDIPLNKQRHLIR